MKIAHDFRRLRLIAQLNCIPQKVYSKEGAVTTIINGERQGPVVTFVTNETSEAVLDGFGIFNGLDGGGGGIRCVGSSPTISNCKIFGNGATNGGGIYCDGASPTIDTCMIRVNEAQESGGGIHCDNSSAPEIRNCFLAFNSAWRGGGICSTGSSTPDILECRIGKNTASFLGDGKGGGILLDGSSATIDRCHIEWNKAMGGAGIALLQSMSTIENCIIRGNETYDYGLGGGGISFWQSSPRISHCTVFENYAFGGGGGIDCDEGSYVELGGCILWYDETDGDGPEIRVRGGSELLVSFSDVEGGEGGAAVDPDSTFRWLVGNIVEDPMLACNAEVGYIGYLTSGSPCIDRMETSNVDIDIQGEGRPYDFDDPEERCCYDMGADEYRPH